MPFDAYSSIQCNCNPCTFLLSLQMREAILPLYQHIWHHIPENSSLVVNRPQVDQCRHEFDIVTGAN